MPDRITPEQRSRLMSHVRGRDTGIERLVRSELHKRGYRFRKHVRSLPGSPDIVLRKYATAVFVDGGFWHGYRFPAWQHTLTEFWKAKIRRNRERDRRNFRKLRNMGWTVIRVWQHEIERDLEYCVDSIEKRFAHKAL
jgi:DNA mismatch endonuclease (patch repair protein)